MIDEHELVRQLRKKHGLTMRQLADMSGVSKATIYRIEHEDCGTTLTVVQLILDAVGLELYIGPKREVKR